MLIVIVLSQLRGSLGGLLGRLLDRPRLLGLAEGSESGGMVARQQCLEALALELRRVGGCAVELGDGAAARREIGDLLLDRLRRLGDLDRRPRL